MVVHSYLWKCCKNFVYLSGAFSLEGMVRELTISPRAAKYLNANGFTMRHQAPIIWPGWTHTVCLILKCSTSHFFFFCSGNKYQYVEHFLHGSGRKGREYQMFFIYRLSVITLISATFLTLAFSNGLSIPI